jgi:exodeoxyribonuclease V gamma subunit
MLVVHSSNRLEALLQQLLQTMQDVPGDPFVAETIVVQNHGMARWISQQIALQQGICANLETPSPGHFMWQLPGYWIEDWPAVPPVSKDSLLWQIYALLPDLLPAPEFTDLRRYLQADKTGSGHFQLSQRIANVFDQYLVYRPSLIRQWETGAAGEQQGDWQSMLWRAVIEAFDQPDAELCHWGRIHERFNDSLLSEVPVKALPERVSVFGVASMPPLYIQMLTHVSAHMDVSIYYVNPCREYWADIVDERGQSKRRARARQAGLDDPTGLLDIGNPLLASWGLAGQAFLDQLLEANVEEQELFIDPAPTTLLGRVQADILDLTDRTGLAPVGIAADDRSLQIHSAHSRLREVQILHDQLLSLFENLPSLTPRDIIVMAPDIDQYAPFIDATFAAVDTPMRIPWSIADRRLRSEQRLLDTFCKLIDLPVSRFEATEMLSLLEIPAVSRRFGLDSSALQQLRQWIAESGIRWSLDADMKTEHELPAEDANTWSFGLKRLYLGYAMPLTNEVPYHGIAPYERIEGTSALHLGALQQFVALCGEWRRELNADRPMAEWIQTLERVTEAFFVPADEEAYALQILRNALHEMAEQAKATQLTRDIGRTVIAEILHQLLDDNANSRQFITGQVTFSNMVPMRSIPFRVVCLLGMNADGFPRDDRPDSFNLVARQPKRGDRSRRSDDRYLFLETLLSARDVFYLSYIGNDVRDDSVKAPSIVVTELQDSINQGYYREDTAGAVQEQDAPACIAVIRHPLQPFSKKYFDGSSPALLNYKPHWFSAAGVTATPQTQPFFEQPLMADDTAGEVEVELHHLLNFYKDPARQFLVQGLQIQLLRDEAQLEDDEPFALSGLQKWEVKQRISSNLVTGANEADILAALRAQGVLPMGASGEQIFNGALTAVEQFLDRLLHRRTNVLPAQDVRLVSGRYLLSGQLEGLQSIERQLPSDAGEESNADDAQTLPETDLLLVRLGRMRSCDRLEAWIKHLVKSLHVEHPGQTLLLCEDSTCILEPATNAAEHLHKLLELYEQGLTTPLHLFPETSLTFATELQAGSDGYDVGPNVRRAWFGGKAHPRAAYQDGEAHQEPTAMVWRAQTPIADERFKAQSAAVFGPLLNNSTVLTADEDDA